MNFLGLMCLLLRKNSLQKLVESVENLMKNLVPKKSLNARLVILNQIEILMEQEISLSSF